MNARQKRFVLEYLKDGNAKQAYIRAGYAPKAAEVCASQLLRIPKVAEAVSAGQDRIMLRLEVSAERVLREVMLVAFANMRNYMSFENGEARLDFSDMNLMKSAVIAELTIDQYTEGRGEDVRTVKRTRFKLADKVRGLELLGKYLKLWTDKFEHSTGEDPIEALIAEFRATKSAFLESKGIDPNQKKTLDALSPAPEEEPK